MLVVKKMVISNEPDPSLIVAHHSARIQKG
jgi:hypothetical protein